MRIEPAWFCDVVLNDRTIAARFLPDGRLEEILCIIYILPVCPLSFECVWQEVTEREATSFPVIAILTPKPSEAGIAWKFWRQEVAQR
ncbi:unnamed protein product [Ectocarpus sp. 8 AP-2014]